MKLRQVDPFLIQLSRYGIFNCQLVREEDGMTLVDTCQQGSAGAILQSVGYLPAEIRRIVLTHAHLDHLDSLDALAQQIPEVEIIVSKREARLLEGDFSLDPEEPQAIIRGDFSPCVAKPTRLVEEGDRIGSLQVIATPGHTPGSMALFDPRNGAVLAGDAFQGKFGLMVAGMLNPLFPFSAFATWDKPSALASAIKLRSLRPAILAVGHGPVFKKPLQLMERAINHAQKTCLACA